MKSGLRAGEGIRRSALAVALGVALTTLAGGAAASALPNYDAMAAPAGFGAAAGHRDIGARAKRAGIDARLGVPTFLQAPAGLAKRAGSLLMVKDVEGLARDYLRDLAPHYKMRAADMDDLELVDSQRLGNGAAIVRFDHRVGGAKVFRERVAVLINADGSLRSVGGSMSSGVRASVKSAKAQPNLSDVDALNRMLQDLGVDGSINGGDLQRSAVKGDYTEYELSDASKGDHFFLEPARVKSVWYRTESGLLPAFYGELQVAGKQGGETLAYSFVIDSVYGKLLFRKNLTEQDTAFTYRVHGEDSGGFYPFVGPQGRQGFPHPTGTPDGYQPPAFVAPNLITLISSPFSMGDPWLPDAASETLGNNVDAFANLFAPDGYQPFNGDFRATLTAGATFDHSYDHNLDPQDSAGQVMAGVTNLFYLNNWLHDWFYDSGFDEAAGNAQDSNFGRGGEEDDSIRAQAQDYAGFNNANMLTPSDGGRPRMRMYIFTGSGPSRVEVSGTEINDTFATGTASFGPVSFDLTNELVQADDGSGTTTDACQALVNGAEVTGKIAFVDRGSCAFTVKALNAQNAGAIGMLLADNAPGGVAGMGGTDPSVTIPSLRITLADGNAIKAALAVPSVVNAHMERQFANRKEGSFDSSVVIHEWGHYISNRLVQNSAGLINNQGRGMGEGWADFHAMLSLVQEGDDLAGVYATGGYDLGGPSPVWAPNDSYYYGIRRYPYSTDMTKNPLTFQYIENGVPLPLSPPPAFGADGSSNAQVHNTGEVWASSLWECYAGLINDSGRLTFDEAQERMKAYLVGGYKMTPAAPTLVEARDAILSVIASQDMDDFAICSAGFAKRGMGVGAIAPDRSDPDNAGVVESFETTGADPQTAVGEVSDSIFSCDSDGILDNGEIGEVVLDVRNGGFSSLDGATVTLSSPQGEVSFTPDTADVPGISVLDTGQLSVPVRLNGASGVFEFQVDAVVSHADAGPAASASGMFLGNADEVSAVLASSDFEVRSLEWAVMSEITTNSTWVRVEAGLQDHRAFGQDIAEAGVQWLISPPLQVSAVDDFTLAFEARHQFEFDGTAWDGGVIEISTDGGSNWTDIGASVSPGYNGTLDGGNPLGARAAYTNTNPSVPSFDAYTANFGTTYAGQTVMIRFGVATDAFVGSYGWEIDNVAFTGIDNTPFGVVASEDSVCGLPPEIFGDGFED